MKMKNNLGSVHELEIKYKPRKTFEPKKITCSKDSEVILRSAFNPDTILCQEEFIILYLDQANNCKGIYKMCRGGISSVTADIRIILSVALKCLAVGIIISHNHPSGNTRPSAQDIQLTEKLVQGSKILDIALLDHIILTANGYFSFADEGMM
jgi:DNA repair protein RadC